MPNYIETRLYNGEVLIKFNPENHQYWIQEAKMRRLAGATTYLGILDKPALIPWAVGITLEFIKLNIEYLKNGSISEIEIYKLASEEHSKKKDEAAEIGSAIHLWIEKYIKDENSEMPENPKVLQGVNSFLEWVEQNKVKFLFSEKIVYSKQYDYCGIVDFACKIGKKTYLGDIKTGNNIYAEVKLQTAAYLKADQEECGAKYDGRVVLRISKESEEEYKGRMLKKEYFAKNPEKLPAYKIFEAVYLDKAEDTVETDFQGFLNCKAVYHWQNKAGKELAAAKEIV